MKKTTSGKSTPKAANINNKTIDDATTIITSGSNASNIDVGADTCSNSSKSTKVGTQTNGTNAPTTRRSASSSGGEEKKISLEEPVTTGKAATVPPGVSSANPNQAILEIERSIIANVSKDFKVSNSKGKKEKEEQEEVEVAPLPPILLVDGATGLPLGNYSADSISGSSGDVRETSSASSEDGSSSAQSLGEIEESPKQFTTLQLTVCEDGTIHFNPTASTDGQPGKQAMANIVID